MTDWEGSVAVQYSGGSGFREVNSKAGTGGGREEGRKGVRGRAGKD